MPTISYITVNGRVSSTTVGVDPNATSPSIGAGGGRIDVLSDALGSVVRTMHDESINGGETLRYAGYGSVLYEAGAWAPPRCGWVGTLGYRNTQMRHAEQYVRARHYSTSEARWTSVDPLWPNEFKYAYVDGNPATWVDPSGMCPELQEPPIELPNLPIGRPGNRPGQSAPRPLNSGGNMPNNAPYDYAPMPHDDFGIWIGLSLTRSFLDWLYQGYTNPCVVNPARRGPLTRTDVGHQVRNAIRPVPTHRIRGRKAPKGAVPYRYKYFDRRKRKMVWGYTWYDPENCPPEKLEAYTQVADELCKEDTSLPFTCGRITPPRQGDTLSQETIHHIRAIMQHIVECANARETRENECFYGGDPGHAEQINQLYNALYNCRELLEGRITRP